MKVTRNTPEQLIVENNPLWLAIFISLFGLTFFGIGMANLGSDPGMGALFVACGLGIAVGFNMIFVRRTQLILDRSRDLVELRRRSWSGYSLMTWQLRYLERAVVQTSRSGDNDTHRAALVISGGMDAGTHPVTLVYSSGRGARRAAEAVNGWLEAAN
ncbi:hypothetical protein AB2B41_02110 [Marimonas sp. MJW-29]|uniref:PH domain-containing protein n=1 Tax=Sulfitobacter sediminis TaxID=3234186 RepID=A0ABV3RHE2_9RHOB